MRQIRTNILVGGSLVVAALLVSCEGPTGPEGTAGTPGLSGLQTVSTETTVASAASATLKPECPPDKKVISGGFAAVGNGSNLVSAFSSYPVDNAWAVGVRNGFVAPVQVTAFAVCATVATSN